MFVGRVIAIDPSGNFINGKGGTGIAMLYKDKGVIKLKEATIKASDFDDKNGYYTEIINKVKSFMDGPKDDILVVIEDFRLQSGKAAQQSNQSMETAELIGILEVKLNDANIKNTRQQNTIKSRWKEDIIIDTYLDMLGLELKGKLSSRHAKDALRHALHGWFFTRKKIKG